MCSTTGGLSAYVGLKTASFGRRMVVSACSVALPVQSICVCVRTHTCS